MAAFIYLRARSLTDDLVDLLIETIHQIGARAERKVARELLEDLKRVSGKQNLLFNLADATLTQPNGVVRDVVFPVVGEQTLRDLVKEWKATSPTYRIMLCTVIRNSYQGHYRRMVPVLLAALQFRSNNDRHRPAMDALDGVKRFADTKAHTSPADEDVPLDGVVRGLWREPLSQPRRRSADRFRSDETMDRSVLQPRLLLCLHGLGTNASLQRMAGLDSGTTARDLAYVRRRYTARGIRTSPRNGTSATAGVPS